MDRKFVHSGIEVIYTPVDEHTGSKGPKVYTAVMENPWKNSEGKWRVNLAGVKNSVGVEEIEKWIR